MRTIDLRDGVYVLECDRRDTALGRALRIQIERYDGAPMAWFDVWSAFAARYPGRWAVEAFPPTDKLMNGANKYHLFVLDAPPFGLDISAPAPTGTTDP